MTYWTGENLDMDLDMEIDPILGHDDDPLNTQVNLTTPQVAANTTGATSSVLGELTESVEGEEGKRSKKKRSKLRSESENSIKQKDTSNIVDPIEIDQGQKEVLIEIERGDEIVAELTTAMKLIIEFLDNWKGLQRLALSNAIRQILTENLNILLRIRDDIKNNFGKEFLTMKEKLEMRKKISNIHIKSEAIIEGILVEEQTKKALEEKLMFQEMIDETSSMDINERLLQEKETLNKPSLRKSENYEDLRRKTQDNKRKRETSD